MAKRKLSTVIEEQVNKTSAILNFVSKKTKNSVAYINLMMALNCLQVVQYAIEKQEEDGDPGDIVDVQASFAQMKDFFRQIEAYKKGVDNES